MMFIKTLQNYFTIAKAQNRGLALSFQNNGVNRYAYSWKAKI